MEFDGRSDVSNLDYLMNLKNILRGESEDKRVWPWLIWFIWKSRNEFLFKGVRRSPEEIHLKAKKEAEDWFLAQIVERETEKASKEELRSKCMHWFPPPTGWLMCNIAFEWCKENRLNGVDWVVRNHKGVVISHSRRAFSNVCSLEEARFSTLMWAVESMTSMHCWDFKELFLALEKPHKWPMLRHQVQEIQLLLNLMEECLMKKVRAEENIGAFFIAQSVTRQGRTQSYVASSHPAWLLEFFVNESRSL